MAQPGKPVFDPHGLWQRYEPTLMRRATLDVKTSRELEISNDGPLRVVYAPLDTIKSDVRVVIVGVTPGAQQAQLAVDAAGRALRSGADPLEACRQAKETAEFARQMRSNLIAMLDDLRLHEALGLGSTRELFSPNWSRRLMNSTSALRYPVFWDGRDYNGYRGPDPRDDDSPLQWMLTDLLVTELSTAPKALVVPLGGIVDTWLAWLENLDHEDRLPRLWRLGGFPHPSGNNGHRARIFAENRDRLRERVAAWAAATS
jgi:hypothetical protein